jgi:uncharacterized protein (DUF58 family)
VRPTFFSSLFLHPRLFLLGASDVAVFVLSYWVPALLLPARIGLLLLGLLVLLDIWLLYGVGAGLTARRELPEKFSNGDPNPVRLYLRSQYAFPVDLKLIDEVPVQFQQRDLSYRLHLPARETGSVSYELRPVKRGEYHFGELLAYVNGPLSLVRRRFRFDASQMVPVYPSYLQMRRYQLMAISNRLTEVGVKQIRRLGHTSEFEQIKEYVRGDDYRTVNWKATARSGKLMVNQYMDERSQQVYCLIDESRVMKMPFEGMTLLDYAVNASLVISNIAIYRQDKAGLLTFSDRISAMVPAAARATQMNRILEVLYRQEPRFLEADYGRLYTYLKRHLTHRALLILFTNFESVQAMRRQLPYLQQLSKAHLLLVVFFENTELNELLHTRPETTEDIYIKTIGEQFAFEKRQIVGELEQHGIMSIFTPPTELTVHTLNKYLELKSRGLA